jgi:hypothetical protein
MERCCETEEGEGRLVSVVVVGRGKGCVKYYVFQVEVEIY